MYAHTPRPPFYGSHLVLFIMVLHLESLDINGASIFHEFENKTDEPTQQVPKGRRLVISNCDVQ